MQSMFESILKAELSLPKLGLRLIVDGLKDRGIALTRSQRAALELRLRNVQRDDFSLALNITDAQLAGSTLTEEERIARKISLDLDGNRISSGIEETIPAIISHCIDEVSALVYAVFPALASFRGCPSRTS